MYESNQNLHQPIQIYLGKSEIDPVFLCHPDVRQKVCDGHVAKNSIINMGMSVFYQFCIHLHLLYCMKIVSVKLGHFGVALRKNYSS